MSFLELFILSVGLSMDAFAASICKGLWMRPFSFRKGILIGLYFGFFQSMMPLLGYFMGRTISPIMESMDHWIVFFLLGMIGLHMIMDSFSPSTSFDSSVSIKEMIPLAFATSMDAFAVGISFSCLKMPLFFPIFFIGFITCILSIFGSKIGSLFGSSSYQSSQILGGLLLIFLGLKVLVEHLGLW